MKHFSQIALSEFVFGAANRWVVPLVVVGQHVDCFGLGCLSDLMGLGHLQAKRLFNDDMMTSLYGGQNHRCVQMVRCRDNHDARVG